MPIEKHFDIPFISSLALREKQIQQNYRPIIAVHKWFARRPGTLFRGLILSEYSDRPLKEAFFSSNDFKGISIADPLMGGGTPLIEANRVGSWYFAIVDVVRVLTNTSNSRSYWSVLKTRLKKEGSQLATNCSQLKMKAADGNFYFTDVANTEQLLRLVQSIPSPKAEPFKQWLAQVGYERIQEIENPELALERMKQLYEQKGYPKD